MQWTSLDDFFRMGGYGFYVWGSFGVAALALIVEPLLLAKRRNEALRAIRREKSAERYTANASSSEPPRSR